ncbi:MAG: ATP-binding cassette domain-containing protein [bacterium]
MAPPLLSLQNIALTFGGTPLLTGADMFVHEQERLCLVGRNGSGKSTLMKIAADLVEADTGDRFIKPGITIRYLEQEPDFSQFSNIGDVARASLTPTDDPYRATYLLQQLGLDEQASPSHLSGGELRRVALAQTLAPAPDILLLDEPTNHLDLPVIDWLEQELRASKAALVLISHDRRFLENLTQRTIWLDRGKTRDLNKGFQAFENWRDTLIEQEELEQHKLDRKIVREEHWITYGVTARRKRNVRRLKELDGLRQQRREATKIQSTAKLEVKQSEQSGKLVIEADSISKAFADRTLIKDFSIRINRGDRIGIAGANGTGKTTLLKIIMGELPPDAGTIRLGSKLEIVTLDQQRARLDPETRLMDTLTGGRGDMVTVGGEPRHVMSYLKDFLFLPEQARSPVKALSGGERGRLALAIALAKPSNLLILDEPTNDLDLETLDLLQELIAAYQGTVILVSHDRDFLDRTVTSILTPCGDGLWRHYPGGYSDMLAQRKNELRPATPPLPSSAPKKTTPAPRQKSTSGKLSYKDKYALEQLPVEIAKLEKQIATLEMDMADPDLFTTAPEKFQSLAKTLDEKRQSLAEKEEQWLSLELKREELEG